MRQIKVIVMAVLLGLTVPTMAQYSQLNSKVEFMSKVDLEFAPFMGNVGDAGEFGYYLANFQSAAGLSAMAGVNISQDWFLGGGVGYHYYANVKDFGTALHGVQVFADMDFRPIWKGIMGVDYQPVTIRWAPVVDLRLGGSILLDAADRYGSNFSPLAEVSAGINWYYMHGLRNMEHNWHAFYLTIGVAYMQQTVFLPIRLGWRW